MKLKLVFIAAMIVSTFVSKAQISENWDKWDNLFGNWTGKGNGEPGSGGGTFTFSPDLDNNIIVRKSHSEFPATENQSAVIHDDLMIIYFDVTKNTTRAIYFDNESHMINYSVFYENNSIIMVSEKTQGTPVFRLTYTIIDKENIKTQFEISQDGDNFFVYLEGNSIKTAN